MHKLSAPWEGPFIVMEGVPNVWNIEHLRHFYP
jgi:hypothetical protein